MRFRALRSELEAARWRESTARVLQLQLEVTLHLQLHVTRGGLAMLRFCSFLFSKAVFSVHKQSRSSSITGLDTELGEITRLGRIAYF